MTRSSAGKLTTKDVAAALFGRRPQSLLVLRQAYRIRETDTDELVSCRHRHQFWLAARLGDRVIVWSYNDHAAADDAFDALLTAEPDWREALPRPNAA